MTLAAPALAQTAPVVKAGSPDAFVGDRSAARAGDAAGKGVIAQGSRDVFINGKPAALGGAQISCGGRVIGGSSSVFVNGKPLAATGDGVAACPQ